MSLSDDIRSLGVIPVVVLDDAGDAMPLAQALVRGGLPAVEITFRTTAAPDAIASVSRRFPDLMVGAGTITTVDQARAARDAGAQFVVSPGLDEATIDWCVAEGLPAIPGIATATEVMRALARGQRLLKFFPAEASGGVPAIRAFAGVFPGAAFVPTGGISADNLGSYLGEASVAACGGTWLAPRDAIRSGEWDAIEARAARALEIVRGARS